MDLVAAGWSLRSDGRRKQLHGPKQVPALIPFDRCWSLTARQKVSHRRSQLIRNNSRHPGCDQAIDLQLRPSWYPSRQAHRPRPTICAGTRAIAAIPASPAPLNALESRRKLYVGSTAKVQSFCKYAQCNLVAEQALVSAESYMVFLLVYKAFISIE